MSKKVKIGFAIPLLIFLVIISGIDVSSGMFPKRAPNVRKSYYGCFTDFDFYILAIGADLVTYRNLTGKDISEDLKQMAKVALAMHRKGIVPTEKGGWVFQPGAFTDHYTYAYAGRKVKSPDMKRSKSPGIAMDSSHFSRWPLWLHGYIKSTERKSTINDYYVNLKNGLNIQFFCKVLVPPSKEFRTYRLKNFMDGRNGVFRWKYKSHPNDGYGPFQLSGTFLYGWWTFLGTENMQSVYKRVHNDLPLSKDERTADPGPWSGLSDKSFMLLTSLAGKMNLSGKVPEVKHKITDREKRLWEESCQNNLLMDIWRGRDAEGVQYSLMVPLHAAFLNGERNWQRQFSMHFQRFAKAGINDMDAPLLGKLHDLYFVMRFLVLANKNSHSALIPNGMDIHIQRYIEKLWSGDNNPVSNYGWGEPKFRNFHKYLNWKLGLSKEWMP